MFIARANTYTYLPYMNGRNSTESAISIAHSISIHLLAKLQLIVVINTFLSLRYIIHSIATTTTHINSNIINSSIAISCILFYTKQSLVPFSRIDNDNCFVACLHLFSFFLNNNKNITCLRSTNIQCILLVLKWKKKPLPYWYFLPAQRVSYGQLLTITIFFLARPIFDVTFTSNPIEQHNIFYKDVNRIKPKWRETKQKYK